MKPGAKVMIRLEACFSYKDQGLAGPETVQVPEIQLETYLGSITTVSLNRALVHDPIHGRYYYTVRTPDRRVRICFPQRLMLSINNVMYNFHSARVKKLEARNLTCIW
jgi:hypothetical protein